MSITAVQLLAASATTNSTSLQSGAFGSATTNGNAIVVCVTGVNNTSTTTLSVTDTAGNSYSCIYCNAYSNGIADVLPDPSSNNIASGTSFVSLWLAQNITGGSSFKVTATWGASGASSALDISAIEISGLGTTVTTDVSQAGIGVATGGNPATGTFSTANANDIILVAAVGVTASTSNSFALPAGFTQIGKSTVASLGKTCLDFGYEIVSSTQSSIDPTFTTVNIHNATAIAVALEQAAAGAPATPTGLAVAPDVSTPMTALDVSWNTSTGATSYTLLQGSSLSGPFSPVQTGISGTSTTVTGLTPGTDYAFEIEAVNGSGTSAPSSPVDCVTGLPLFRPAPMNGIGSGGRFFANPIG